MEMPQVGVSHREMLLGQSSSDSRSFVKSKISVHRAEVVSISG